MESGEWKGMKNKKEEREEKEKGGTRSVYIRKRDDGWSGGRGVPRSSCPWSPFSFSEHPLLPLHSIQSNRARA